MPDYKIITISNRRPTEYYYTYDQLFKSVPGHDILVLGQQPGEYTGLSDKPRILYHAIKNGLIKEEIIVFIDAWDVVFAASPDEVIDKFECFDYDIVIGAEKNCFPANFKKEFDSHKYPLNTQYKYLNSGVIVGYTDAILEVLEAMDAPNLPIDYHDGRTGRNFHFNDQAYYADLYLRQPVNIMLDRFCEIAQNMQDVTPEELDFTGERIRNIETDSEPVIWHWNGSSKDKWSREVILKHLNLL